MPAGETVHQSGSVKQTEAIAAELAQSISGGQVVALDGELGAGKTQFVRGLVRGLGGPVRAVSSPTFVLLNVYPGGRLTVYHLDAYRISGSEEFEAIGFAELLEQGGVVVVEWAQRVKELLPSGHVAVTITPTAQSTREIKIEHRAAAQG